MKREDIIRMALEAGFYEYRDNRLDCVPEELERFAALVAAAERDEILKLCEPPENSHQYVHTFKKIIRARGQA
jgi:hypothetical protein